MIFTPNSKKVNQYKIKKHQYQPKKLLPNKKPNSPPPQTKITKTHKQLLSIDFLN
ncbi:hypothetical protein PALI_b0256 [Pseudoalteromonas aliena SW19]|uniref:Uncharacterized protein n=1 Tax=Pseudoalteromonas aliena SW19 TaxID=1314866 RepID=A0ABR9E3W2_9GAMM|nr:hypothetical protein [Pseudoalteromonas aliena SW19]